MINIECKMDDFLEEFEKDFKKTIKEGYITIIEKEVKKELDKTSLNENEKEIKVNEITKEISNSLQIKKMKK